MNCNCSVNPSRQGNVLLQSTATTCTSFNTTAAVATFQRLLLSDQNKDLEEPEEEEEQEDEEEFEELTDHVNNPNHEAANLIAPENVAVCRLTETLFTESFTLNTCITNSFKKPSKTVRKNVSIRSVFQ